MNQPVPAPRKVRAKHGRRKWLAIVLAVVIVALAAYVGWYLVRFQFNNEYRQYVTGNPPMETGAAFAPIAEEAGDVAGYALAAQSDELKLYANPDTGAVAVYDKRNGQTVYSNPVNADDDPVANKTNKNYLKSQFVLDYFNSARTTGTYDSYSQSVELGQMTAESIADGVRFVYDVGQKPTIDFYVPTWMSAEKFDELTAQMSDRDKSTMARMYVNEGDDKYTLITAAQANARNRRSLEKLLFEHGFTEEDYWEQMALGEEAAAEAINFTIALEYRLKGDSVEVTIPSESITETGGGMIYRVRLMEFFGAAEAGEDGYLVVPNGSGSLIRFDNGKTNAAAYSQYIYGMDDIDAEYVQTQITQTARLPLYGICRRDSSILATVEQGAPLCFLSADISGRNNSYNNAYPTFLLHGYERLSMFGVSGSEADIPIVEKDAYKQDFTVRFTLLTEENKGYSGLANYYRERLIAEGKLTRKEAGGDIPFYLDVIGGVKETAHILGAQYLRVNAMTTFEQAEKMAQTLDDLGVKNQQLILRGWMNGGYYHDVPDRVRVLWELGGKKGLQHLQATMEGLGGTLYPDVAFQHVTQISKRYHASREASRYYGSGYSVILGQLSHISLRRTSSKGYVETLYSLLSPRFLPGYVDKFLSKYGKLNVNAVSLRDLGDALQSDRRRTHVIDREASLDVVEAQLDKLGEACDAVLMSGGNLYALDIANHVVDAPMIASDYFIIDRQIPLYQMIVHGCVDYAGEPMNMSGDEDKRIALLEMVEYGASCRYLLTWQEATDMKETGLNRYYSTYFDAWKDDAAAMYQQLNEALAPVSGAAMVKHETLANGVRRVRYDNGVTIYVNYSDKDATADGCRVPAMSSLTVGGEKQ